MPEQEKNINKQETGQAGDRRSDAAVKTVDNGAATISPVIIIPPVIIAAVMACLLSVVYGFTKEPIAEAKLAEKREKLTAVMPAFDNDPLQSEEQLSEAPKGKAGNVIVYTGKTGEEVSGYGIVSAVGSGYSGYFSVVFGLDADMRIKEVRILETAETPGLGTKADPLIIDQLAGKKLGEFNIAVKKDGGDVDAISGATITSRAVCDAVVQGIEAFEQGGGNDGE